MSRFRVSLYRRPLRKAARGLRRVSGLNKGLSDPGFKGLGKYGLGFWGSGAVRCLSHWHGLPTAAAAQDPKWRGP